MSKGLLLVVSAPSAGGKGTILKELLQTEADLRMSVSATTRQPRPGEEHGRPYYFISREEFQAQVSQGMMLEHAEYVGNCYGTPRGPVDQWREEGLDVVLEIEVQRLRDRGTEDEATVQKRLKTALTELEHAKDYDYVVVNDRLEDAVEDMRAILRSEKRKYERNTDFIRKVIAHAETIR